MLKQGDTIGICAPSGSFDIQKFETGLKVIKDMGFKVLVPEDIHAKKRYLAGNDSLRAKVITDFFADTEVKAIMCARGGFGAIRVLDYLDFETIGKNPKLFIGFSDITALLVSLANLSQIKTIHGPNITSLAEAERETKDSLYELLIHGFTGIRVKTPVVLNRGLCTGRILGGNLATLNHLVGTKYQVDLKDSIFFFEDTGEPPYKIDRMLTQMKMAGCFRGIKGIVAGSFKNCEDVEMVQEIIKEVFDEYQVPILAGIESGHGKINLSLPLGVKVKMDTDKATMEWNI